MPAETKLINFRVPLDELQAWDDAAHYARLTRSAWMRAVLNDAVGAVRAPVPAPPPVDATRAQEVARSLLDQARQVTKQSDKSPCNNRVPKGTFCKRCGRVHA